MAYVFTKPGPVWVNTNEIAQLSASDAASGDWFANSVAIDNQTIVIGAKEESGVASGSGSAYVFVKPGPAWVTGTETGKFTASDGANLDDFGRDVDIDGDVVIIGAFQDDSPVSNAGSAYIFEKPGGGWTSMTESAKLTASDQANADYLGQSVSISGNHILAAAPGDDENGSSSGSVYFYEKPGANWLTATETSKASPYFEWFGTAFFGCDVAIDGNYAVVGSRAAYSNQGTAYVLFFDGTSWEKVAELSASDAAAGDWYGFSVDMSGDVIVIGAHYDDDSGSASGSAYVYVMPGGGWVDMTETAKLTASVGFMNDYFGYDVSIDGDVIVVGAHGDDEGAGDSGG